MGHCFSWDHTVLATPKGLDELVLDSQESLYFSQILKDLMKPSTRYQNRDGGKEICVKKTSQILLWN